ncbi:alpha-glycosidase, partial [Enterococcus sp. S181_ASV_20]|nr:alpha-glycosidase [Enterococcus sp. S181_ASV_20]
LYYGDEVGLDGGIDPDCRKCMIWDPEKQDLQLFEFVKQLIALRRENQFTLCEGSLEWQKVDTSTGTLIFSRDISNEKIIGIFNTGNHSIFEQVSDEVLML